MRDKPHKDFKLEWPGGIVPEWARPKQNANRRRGAKPARGGAGSGKRERLQKVMAQSGHGSRRNIEILIAQGHITINGQVAKLGDSVGPGDKVKLDGKLIRLRFGEPLPRVLMYHKPTGEIVTRDDPEKRPTVFDKLPKVNNGRWVSVGRLDFNTEGLLIFTTNGELANRLTHPRFEVEREYAVRVMGELTEEQGAKLLTEGVDIDGELCKFDAIEDRGGEGSNHWYHVILREGKNREVRRMMEAVGLMVSRLIRVRFGSVELPGFLKRGQMREMDEEQVQNLIAFAGMNEPEAASADGEHEHEDEHDNIGNRLIDAPQVPDEEPAIDDDVGNRVHAREAQRAQHEPDGNRHHPATATRAPKPGQPPQQQRRAPGGKPFGFKKRGKGHGQGQGAAQGQGAVQGQGAAQGQGRGGQGQGQPAQQHRKQGQQPHAQGQGPAQGHAHAPNAGPSQGKPGRHRRNKNRNRQRGAVDAHEQQPATNTNREPV
jgi:23S rRNA pseudouridine2605 synthase